MTSFPFPGLSLCSHSSLQLAITPTQHLNVFIFITFLKFSSCISIDLSVAGSEQLSKWLLGFGESTNSLHSTNVYDVCGKQAKCWVLRQAISLALTRKRAIRNDQTTDDGKASWRLWGCTEIRQQEITVTPRPRGQRWNPVAGVTR